MAKSYWIYKTEPNTYSFDNLVKDKETYWDGVRNFQARNNLKLAKKGDEVFIYHSVGPKEVVGIAEVVKEHYPDPTVKEAKNPWVVVNIRPKKTLKKPVGLDQFKNDRTLSDTPLVKQSRLSVIPLSQSEAKRILHLSS